MWCLIVQRVNTASADTDINGVNTASHVNCTPLIWPSEFKVKLVWRTATKMTKANGKYVLQEATLNLTKGGSSKPSFPLRHWWTVMMSLNSDFCLIPQLLDAVNSLASSPLAQGRSSQRESNTGKIEWSTTHGKTNTGEGLHFRLCINRYYLTWSASTASSGEPSPMSQ